MRKIYPVLVALLLALPLAATAKAQVAVGVGVGPEVAYAPAATRTTVVRLFSRIRPSPIAIAYQTHVGR